MNDQAPSSSTSGASAVPVGFGFDHPDDQWLDCLRRAHDLSPPGRIGEYELLEEVNRGGQGVLYRARQPNTNRLIALKRLHSGSFSTPAMHARFAREVEIAADLAHPNIVTVFGMEFVDGQPNLAMAWIDGQPVDRWAQGGEGGRRSVDDVLRLFATLCDAVHHAHQRGVLHRDLKPSNILVDVQDRPHILDFGLAKVLRDDDSRAIHLTRTQDFVGTPAYASPEQVRGRAAEVDVRSDVYALGVILFQMLTGRLPYPADCNLADLLQAIQHREPPAPSSLDRRVDREIDAIVHKALAKWAAERYASVDGLAADVRRYLNNEPVLAHPPTAAYQLRKLVARHRIGFVFAAGLAVLILAFTVSLGVMSLRLNTQRAAAVAAQQEEAHARRIAEQVNALLGDILVAAEPDRAKGEPITVREVLDKAATEIDQRDDLAAEVESSVRGSIGRAYWTLGLPDSAMPHLERAVQLAREAHGARHPEVATHLESLAHVYQDKARLADAQGLYEEVLEIRRAVQEPDLSEIAVTLANLAELAISRNELETGEVLLNQAIEMLVRKVGESHHRTLAARLDLATLYHHRGEHARAVEHLRELLPRVRETLGPTHTRTLQTLNNLGISLKSSGQFDEALTCYTELIESGRRVYGEDHPHTINAVANLASLHQARGDLEQAHALLSETLRKARAVMGEQDPTTLALMNNFAGVLRARGDGDGAVKVFRESVDGHRRIFGENHPATAISKAGLAAALLRDGESESNYAECEQLLVSALAVFEARFPADHPYRRKTVDSLRKLYGPEKMNEAAKLARLDGGESRPPEE